MIGGAGEADVGEPALIKQLLVHRGIKVDAAFTQVATIAVGQDGGVAGRAGELALAQTEYEHRLHESCAGAIDLANEDLIHRLGRDGEIEAVETGFQNIEELGGCHGFGAEQLDQFVEELNEVPPDLGVFRGTLFLARRLGGDDPARDRLANVETFEGLEDFGGELLHGKTIGAAKGRQEGAEILHHLRANNFGLTGFGCGPIASSGVVRRAGW